MALFVDFTGLNTLIQEPVDITTNTIGASGSVTASATNVRNTSIESIDAADYLVGLNIHRNGPYGYPLFRQIRNSDNAVIRKQRLVNTFSHFEYPGDPVVHKKGHNSYFTTWIRYGGGDGSGAGGLLPKDGESLTILLNTTTYTVNFHSGTWEDPTGNNRSVETSFGMSTSNELNIDVDGLGVTNVAGLIKNAVDALNLSGVRPIYEYTNNKEIRHRIMARTIGPNGTPIKSDATRVENIKSWNQIGRLQEVVNVVPQKRGPLQHFTEVPVVSKHKPLKLVGSITIENETTNQDTLEEVEILTTLGNQTQYFSNQPINQFFNVDETLDDDYENFIDLYLDGGLDGDESPIDEFRSVNYSQIIYPREVHTYTNNMRNRPNFVSRYWRDSRANRTRVSSSTDGLTNGFGFNIFSQSAWVLDAESNFKDLSFNITPGALTVYGAYNYVSASDDANGPKYGWGLYIPSSSAGDDHSLFLAVTGGHKEMPDNTREPSTMVSLADPSHGTETSSLYVDPQFGASVESTKNVITHVSNWFQNRGFANPLSSIDDGSPISPPFVRRTVGHIPIIDRNKGFAIANLGSTEQTAWMQKHSASCLSFWIQPAPFQAGTDPAGILYEERDSSDRVIKQLRFYDDGDGSLQLKLGTVFTSSLDDSEQTFSALHDDTLDAHVSYAWDNIWGSANRFGTTSRGKWNHLFIELNLSGSDDESSETSGSHFRAAHTDGGNEFLPKLWINGVLHSTNSGHPDPTVTKDDYQFLTGNVGRLRMLDSNSSIKKTAANNHLTGTFGAISPYTAKGHSYSYWIKFAAEAWSEGTPHQIFSIKDSAGDPVISHYYHRTDTGVTAPALVTSYKSKADNKVWALYTTIPNSITFGVDTWHHVSYTLHTGSSDMTSTFMINGAAVWSNPDSSNAVGKWRTGTTGSNPAYTYDGTMSNTEWAALSSSFSLEVLGTSATAEGIAVRSDWNNISIDEMYQWAGGLTSSAQAALYDSGARTTQITDTYPATDKTQELEVYNASNALLKHSWRTPLMHCDYDDVLGIGKRETTWESDEYEIRPFNRTILGGKSAKDFQDECIDNGDNNGQFDFACWFKCTDQLRNTKSIKAHYQKGLAIDPDVADLTSFGTNLPNFDGDKTTKPLFISFWFKPSEDPANWKSSNREPCFVLLQDQIMIHTPGNSGFLYFTLNDYKNEDSVETNNDFRTNDTVDNIFYENEWSWVAIHWNGLSGRRGLVKFTVRTPGRSTFSMTSRSTSENPMDCAPPAQADISYNHRNWGSLLSKNGFNAGGNRWAPPSGSMAEFMVVTDPLPPREFDTYTGSIYNSGKGVDISTLTLPSANSFGGDGVASQGSFTDGPWTGARSIKISNTHQNGSKLDFSSLSFTPDTGITAMWWFKADSFDYADWGGGVFCSFRTDSGATVGYIRRSNANDLVGYFACGYLGVGESSGGQVGQWICRMNFEDVADKIGNDTWHFICFRWDGSTDGSGNVQNCYLHIDGNMIEATPQSVTYAINNAVLGNMRTIGKFGFHTASPTTDNDCRTQYAGVRLFDKYFTSDHVNTVRSTIQWTYVESDPDWYTSLQDDLYGSCRLYAPCSDGLGDTVSSLKNKMNNSPSLHTYYHLGSEDELCYIPMGDRIFSASVNNSGSYGGSLGFHTEGAIYMDGGPKTWTLDSNREHSIIYMPAGTGQPRNISVNMADDWKTLELTLSASGGGYSLVSSIPRSSDARVKVSNDNIIIPNKWYHLYAKYINCGSGDSGPTVKVYLNGDDNAVTWNTSHPWNQDGSGGMVELMSSWVRSSPGVNRRFVGYIQDMCFWSNVGGGNIGLGARGKGMYHSSSYGAYAGSPYIDLSDSNLYQALRVGYRQGESSTHDPLKLGGTCTADPAIGGLTNLATYKMIDRPRYLFEPTHQTYDSPQIAISFWATFTTDKDQTILSFVGDTVRGDSLSPHSALTTYTGQDSSDDLSKTKLLEIKLDYINASESKIKVLVYYKQNPVTISTTATPTYMETFESDAISNTDLQTRSHYTIQLYEQSFGTERIVAFFRNGTTKIGAQPSASGTWAETAGGLRSFNSIVIGDETSDLSVGTKIDDIYIGKYDDSFIMLYNTDVPSRLYNDGSSYDYNVETAYGASIIAVYKMGDSESSSYSNNAILALGDTITDQSSNDLHLNSPHANKWKVAETGGSNSDLKAYWPFDGDADSSNLIGADTNLASSIGSYPLTTKNAGWDYDYTFDSYYLGTLKWLANHTGPSVVTFYNTWDGSHVGNTGVFNKKSDNTNNALHALYVADTAIYSGFLAADDVSCAKAEITGSIGSDTTVLNENKITFVHGAGGSGNIYIINFADGTTTSDATFADADGHGYRQATIYTGDKTANDDVVTAIYTLFAHFDTEQNTGGNYTTTDTTGEMSIEAVTAANQTYDIQVSYNGPASHFTIKTMKGYASLPAALTGYPSFHYRQKDDTDLHRNLKSGTNGLNYSAKPSIWFHANTDHYLGMGNYSKNSGSIENPESYDMTHRRMHYNNSDADNTTESIYVYVESDTCLDSGSYQQLNLKSTPNLDVNFIHIMENPANNSTSGSAGTLLLTPGTPNPLVGGSTGARAYLGPGVLQNNYNQFTYLISSGSTAEVDPQLSASACYFRRHSLTASTSVVAPFSGFLAKLTASHEDAGSPHTKLKGHVTASHLYLGAAKWETGHFAGSYDTEGTFQFKSKKPFFDTYTDFIADARPLMKDYGIVPEFNMSSHVEKYLAIGSTEQKLDIFEMTGGLATADISTKSDFYKIYSTTDFLKHFEIVQEDHSDFVDPFSIKLKCKALKKFIPYEGFYPAQRSVQIAQQFHSSYGRNLNIAGDYNLEGSNNYGVQYLLNPLFSPGILFNTIKSGVAVDYPLITDTASVGKILGSQEGGAMIAQPFDTRVPFEALMEPEKYLANLRLASIEPDPNGDTGLQVQWNGQGDELYHLMISNFLSEVPEFYLKNKTFTTIASLSQGDANFGNVTAGKTYMMRLKMYRTISGSKGVATTAAGSTYGAKSFGVPQDNGTMTEGFTMYSRPSAFGPPQSFEIGTPPKIVWTCSNTAASNVGYFLFTIGGKKYNVSNNPHGAGSNSTAWVTGSTDDSLSEDYHVLFDNTATPTDTKGGHATFVSDMMNLIPGYDAVADLDPTNPTVTITPSHDNGDWHNFVYSDNTADGDAATTALVVGEHSPEYWGRYKGVSLAHDFSYKTGSAITSGRGNAAQAGYNYPYTPPYYHGEAWADITYTPSTTGKKSLVEILNNSSVEFYRHFQSSSVGVIPGISNQTVLINDQAMQLASSVNLFSKGVLEQDISAVGASGIGSITNVQVDTDISNKYRWIIQTKFETPCLNFNHYNYGTASGGGTSPSNYGITLPGVGPMQTPIGMWHQYGHIPQRSDEGIFLQVEDVPDGWVLNAMQKTKEEFIAHESLASVCGFSTDPIRIGEVDEVKTISEAVIAIPFYERGGRRHFYKMNKQQIDFALDPSRRNLVGTTVIEMVEKMQKFILPPPLDFIKNRAIAPFSMYIFEFSHNFSKQDLADMWQNLPPDINNIMEEDEVSISHELFAYELLGSGGSYRKGRNSEVELVRNERGDFINPDIQWMVFKAKQRGKSNYFEKIFARNESQQLLSQRLKLGVSADTLGKSKKVSYNWPYDFCSLVEGIKISAEIDFLEMDEEESNKLERPVMKLKAKDRVFEPKETIKSDILKSVSGIGQIAKPTELPVDAREKAKTKKRRGKIKRQRRKPRKSTRKRDSQSSQVKDSKNKGKR